MKGGNQYFWISLWFANCFIKFAAGNIIAREKRLFDGELNVNIK